MFSKTLLFVLIVNLISDYSYGQKHKKFFRKDYKYLEDTESFYKIHTTFRTWFDSKAVCKLEGAKLFYPEDEKEVEVVTSFWNSTQPFDWVFIGISDLVVEGAFETIDGRPVTDVYNRWGPGEPNNSGGIEDCVILRNDKTYNDDHCYKKFPAVCKKTLQSLQWDQHCNIPSSGYVYNNDFGGRCYKFHMNPLNWTEAYAVCNAEQSYLAVINSHSEADYLGQLAQTTPVKKVAGSVKISYLPRAIHAGFSYKADEGWQTLKGTSLEESGYDNWGDKQPDGGDLEQCGSMSYNGKLNDISCDTRSFFICEHEVEKQS